MLTVEDPCTETVTWFVLRECAQLSGEQFDAFRRILGNDFRPPQQRGGRTIRSTGGKTTSDDVVCLSARFTPPFVLEQRLDALTDLLANLADASNIFALGILQRPIVAFQARNDRTLIPTPHRDQHLGSLGQLRSQLRRRRP